MNAYELADWVKEYAFLKDEDIALEPVINMLRQQADRIAELEKELQRIVANAEFELDRAYWKIKELTKQLQDELFEEFINTEYKGHEKYDAFKII